MDKKLTRKAVLKDLIAQARRHLQSSAYIISRDEKTQYGIDPRLVIYTDPKSFVAEEYRQVRTNLRCLQPDNPLRTIVITSAYRKEGKTITAANLALALSLHKDEKTILVDSDLRKPSIHKLFNVPRKPGLSDVLAGNFNLETLIEKPVFENLYILPAGAEVDQPTELISGTLMKETVQKLKDNFNYVIFDAAPINLITDAGIIGNLADGSLLIVQAGQSREKDVETAYRLLEDARAHPVATILTNTVSYAPQYLYKYKYTY